MYIHVTKYYLVRVCTWYNYYGIPAEFVDYSTCVLVQMYIVHRYIVHMYMLVCAMYTVHMYM